MKDIIDRLKKYDGSSGLTLRKGVDESLLRNVERVYNITLPDDFKEFYRFSDGFETEEDMFNMISLAEIIDNKDRHKGEPLYIAEYMIYCDMWELEINPDDCNDYKIINLSANSNRLILTKSLTEFISRFLKGGVFEDGGLYDWHEETESQSIYPTNPKTLELLLAVYYFALTHGLISRQEVIDWADQFILAEDEPNHFFIEVSLSHDLNELLSVIRPLAAPESDASVRAILGLLYHGLSEGVITADIAVAAIDKCNAHKFLTRSEVDDVYELTDEIWIGDQTLDKEQLTEKVLAFLVFYKEFELKNYKVWEIINYRIESGFKGQTQGSIYKPETKQSSTLKFYLHTAVHLLAVITLIIVVTTFKMVEDNIPLTKLRNDLYQFSILYFFFFVCYYVIAGIYWAIMKVFPASKR